MDGENPVRRMRTRRGSTETNLNAGTLTPKKSTRQPKLTSINEIEKKTRQKKDKKNVDEDASSVSTEHSIESMQNCKVVLETIDNEHLFSSVPRTRSRKKSALTEENVAALSPASSRRTKRAVSIVSEETTTTQTASQPRRSMRRASMAAASAPVVETPKRELRSTRAISNSSEDLPVKPETPIASKNRGRSRLAKKMSDSESAEEDERASMDVPIKSSGRRKKSPTGSQTPKETGEAMLDVPPKPKSGRKKSPVVAMVKKELELKDTAAANDVICIMDSDDENSADLVPTKQTEHNQTSTVTTISETPNELVVKESEAVVNSPVHAKSRPSISNWPKSTLREEEEEPMDWDEPIESENSMVINDPTEIHNRVDEIMGTASATSSAASPGISNVSETARPSEPIDTVVLVEGKRVSVRKAVTPVKVASPLKGTSQLMGATISSEQAASPNSNARQLSKSFVHDDQSNDQVSEAPVSGEKSPTISPSKLVNDTADPNNSLDVTANFDAIAEYLTETCSNEAAIDVEFEAAAEFSQSNTGTVSTAVTPSDSIAQNDPAVVEIAITDEPRPATSAAQGSLNMAPYGANIPKTDTEKAAAKLESNESSTALESHYDLAADDLVIETDQMVDVTVENATASSAQIEQPLATSEHIHDDDTIAKTPALTTPVASKSLDVEPLTVKTPKSAVVNRSVDEPRHEPSAVSDHIIVEKSIIAAPRSPKSAAMESPVATPKLAKEVRASSNEIASASPRPTNEVIQPANESVTHTPKANDQVTQPLEVHSAQTPKAIDVEHTKYTPETTTKTTVEVRAVQTPIATLEEHATQTPKTTVEVRAVQTPIATLEEHATQTPKTTVEVRAAQTTKTISEEYAPQTPKSKQTPKSIQIEAKEIETEKGGIESTPINRKIFKRQDTPYPDQDELLKASATDSSQVVSASSAEKLKDHLNGSREKLRTLSSSWAASIKQNSINAYIDGINARNKSNTGAESEAPPKPFIVARNRWADNDEDSEADEEMNVEEEDIDGEEDDNDDAEQLKNEFIDDEAEEVEDSEDSMDSEERREIEENELPDYGIDLGSEDSYDDMGNEDDDDDSFIVSDSEVRDELIDSEDEIDKIVGKPKFKRISRMLSHSDDGEDDDGTNNVKNKSLVEAILNGSKNAAEKTDATTEEGPAASTSSVEAHKEAVVAETVGTEANPLPQIKVTAATRIEIRKPKEARRSSVAFEYAEESFENSVLFVEADAAINKSVTQDGFEESERSPLEGQAKEASRRSKQLHVSMIFEEEDATAENSVNMSVGKVATEFNETDNVPTHENADEASEEAHGVEHESSGSDAEDDNICYSLNTAHPMIADFLRSTNLNYQNSEHMKEASSSNESEDGPAPGDKTVKSSEESVTEKSQSKVKAGDGNISLPITLIQREDKENVSANQLSVAASRSLQNNNNTSLSAPFKTFAVKSQKRSFSEIDSNQTLQLNAFSTHFDANASNLRRSSTPNQKALFKTQKMAPHSSSTGSPSTSKNSPKSGEPPTKIIMESPPETNNNDKSSHKYTSIENPLKAVSFTDVLNRCESELIASAEKKQKDKSENADADEGQLEKRERKKVRKIEKTAARAMAEETKRQQLEDAKKSAAERKIQKQSKQDGKSSSSASAPSKSALQSTSTGERNKRNCPYSFEEEDSNFAKQPIARKPKHLKILTASGEFNVSPMSPPHNQFGFVETPLTFTPRTFKSEPMLKNLQSPHYAAQIKKRRRLNDSEELDVFQLKPKWELHNEKRRRLGDEVCVLNADQTRVITNHRKQPSCTLIPIELVEFRKKNLYRKGIPRQDARTLLKNREKAAASKRL